MKKRILLIILLIFIFAIAAAFLYVSLQMSPVSKNKEAEKVRFEVPFGTPARTVISNLKKAELIKNEDFMYAVIKYPFLMKVFFPKAQFDKIELKSGTYYLSPSMDYTELLTILSSGQQEYIHFSVPEGFTITKIAQLLEDNGVCPKDDFIRSCKNPDILKEYNIPAESCEGFLFPVWIFSGNQNPRPSPFRRLRHCKRLYRQSKSPNLCAPICSK